MKRFGITSTAILSLLLASGVAYSQQEPKNEKQDHPQREEQQQAKPDPQHAQQEQHQQRQEQSKQDEQHAQQQQRQEQSKQSDQHAQQQQRQEQSKQNEQHAQRKQNAPAHSQEQHQALRTSFQEHRSQRWDSDHRTWQQRGGYNGYRIPDDRFRGRFGEEHAFRIYGLPFVTVGGYPRFQYEGYWFSIIDPWPGTWANDWYDNDDVYVVYVDNGYYLFNRRYPNIGMAISISM